MSIKPIKPKPKGTTNSQPTLQERLRKLLWVPCSLTAESAKLIGDSADALDSAERRMIDAARDGYERGYRECASEAITEKQVEAACVCCYGGEWSILTKTERMTVRGDFKEYLEAARDAKL